MGLTNGQAPDPALSAMEHSQGAGSCLTRCANYVKS